MVRFSFQKLKSDKVGRLFNLFLFSLFLYLAAGKALAHEYWFEPEKFFLKSGEKTPIHLYVGEGLKMEEEREFQSSKTNLFSIFSRKGKVDLLSSSIENSRPIMTFSASDEGTYLLAMERNWSYITLEAKDFENYLREDGMEYIIEERKRLGESNLQANERYSRYIKSLIQVGKEADDTATKKIGLMLEILPLNNPYEKKLNDKLEFQVLFNSRPLANKKIFADNRNGLEISKKAFVTDKEGKFTLRLDKKGIWLVRMVFMRRCQNSCQGAQWESFWAAVSFGVK